MRAKRLNELELVFTSKEQIGITLNPKQTVRLGILCVEFSNALEIRMKFFSTNRVAYFSNYKTQDKIYQFGYDDISH